MPWYFIIPEAGVNLSGNPSLEINASTGFSPIGIGTAFSRVSTTARWGGWSMRVDPVANVGAGVIHTVPGCTIGQVYCGSAWVLGETGVPYHIYFGDANGILKAGSQEEAFIGDGEWHRYHGAFIADGTTVYLCVAKDGSASVASFYIDGWQVEEGLDPTTYMDGDQFGCEWLGVSHLSATARSAMARAGGQIVDLSDYNVTVTHSVGLGMPPLKHKALELPHQEGALIDDIHVQPRVLTILCWANADPLAATDADLYQARDDLVNAMKPDRVATLQPLTLRFEGPTQTFEFSGYYEGGLERNFTEWRLEKFIIRLLCYDPFLYNVGEMAEAMPVMDSGTFSYVCARLRASDGQWDPLGPTSAGDLIYALLVSSDGVIYVGGAFTGWDGNAGWDYMVKWEDGAWAMCGGVNDLNAAVRALEMSSDPRVMYVGGAFTNVDGIAAADYVCKYDLDGNSFSALLGAGTGTVYALALAPNDDLYIGGDFTNWAAIAAADYIAMYDASANAYTAVGVGFNSQVRALAVVPITGDVYAGGVFTEDGSANPMVCIAKYDGSDWAEVGGGLDIVGGGGGVYALAIDAAGNLYAGGNFTQTADGILTGLNRIAFFDGNCWLGLGVGTDNNVYSLAISQEGLVHAGGSFNGVGGLNSPHYARWNGYSWMLPDIILPAGIVYALAVARPDPIIKQVYDVVVGFSVSGTAYFADLTTAINTAQARAYPYFRFKIEGGGDVISIRNETNGKELAFKNLFLMDGETMYVDCRPGKRRIWSDRRPNLLGFLLRPSDLATFSLEKGDNQITCLIYYINEVDPECFIIWRNTFWSVDQL